MATGITALVASLLTVGVTDSPAIAADGRDFNAGNIISDATFYDSGTMDVAQIQAFLNARRPTCAAGHICLKDYQDSFASRAANSRCGFLQGQRMSAAAIIYWVARACGINPQSLIVLLEKEQGLVSASSPSAAKYRIAMGYGCPDTAPCDSLYYGFFNQVYSAARQFKIYQDSPSSFRYRAGRANDIQWHPNAACGASSVFIENQATASLYNYTPYRPNQAALANMYGTGDGCSSYGNRNFWRIFSDWFGNTQGGGDFARTASDPRIYLLVGGIKHYVPTSAVFQALAPLGGYRTVSADYLATFAEGKTASELVRHSQSGEIALVQAGQRHRFPSCEMLALYGYACTDAMDLAPSQFARIPGGHEMTAFFRVGSGSTVHFVTEGKKVSFTSLEALDAYAGARPRYLGSMRAEVAARYPNGRALAAPMSLAKYPDSPTVYLLDGWDRKIPISSFTTAAELGVSGYRTEPAPVLNGYTTSSAPLTFAVRCDTSVFIAGSGVLTRVASGQVPGVAVTDLSTASCARMAKNPGQFEGPPFVAPASGSVVSALLDGRLREVPDYASLVALNGGSPPPVARFLPATLAGISTGEALLRPGSLVRTASDARIFLIDGMNRRIPVESFDVTLEFGLNGWSYAPAAALGTYSTDGTPLGRIWNCAGTRYFGGSGTLYPLAGSAGTGLAVSELSGTTCSRFSRSAENPIPRLYIKTTGAPTVYYVEQGRSRAVSSWQALLESNAGAVPRIVSVSAATIASIPAGLPL